MEFCRIFPATHHVTSEDRMEQAHPAIKDELKECPQELKSQGKMVEQKRHVVL
jgi:excinuclease ABC subunit B